VIVSARDCAGKAATAIAAANGSNLFNGFSMDVFPRFLDGFDAVYRQ
jgi:hypothetical protein